MSQQDGRTLLVSGGAAGLGAAVVAAAAERGWRPLVLDKQAPSGPVADFRAVDVGDSAETEDAVQQLVREHGGLDAVVTAAGVDSCGPLTSVSAADWERVIRVNLLGTAAVVRAALPALQRSHGRIVTVASTLGLRVAGDASAYCASKFGVVGFTRAMAMELAGQVGVTLAIPGGMRTGFFDGREEQYKPPDVTKLNRPEHVAENIMHVLTRPRGAEIRELVMCHEEEPSWP
ncbi:SDR family oxidoreductase [Labedaea rhizosphaerae]|uniref:NADP-dependent 3-hydroxy acid dehydrogenase YdfG n=1 Tax=Labedaea rhizosphaerae TaxID=598644 RepID=A0A4R6SAD3_LABRH|nr:SDR family oxidoreductase [Labedaea rhizosphaerae]TDP96463.1 NADP-dependent 3-hydroxy acid dehydrogenase YdfG [Labedaea rhizosphaerae]